jgi:subtilisin family serine protease
MPRVASLALALLLAVVASPASTSDVAAAVAAPQTDLDGTADASSRANPDGRWLVVYRDDTDVTAANARAKGHGIKADKRFKHALKGYAAKLSRAQVAAVASDPAVAYVVADETISLQAQTIPRGIRRVEGLRNRAAKIDGRDERVDADVAIFDTGIDRHPDLNVVGGHSCATTSPAAWGDPNGHGTHVAGTVGAIDNGSGVVGVAPGVRLWSVRILDASGTGLVSWYVCGMDWIAAQRDPVDPSRPLIEAVNMSVAKSGSDDRNCGYTNKDAIHKAICRLVASGVTVIAAAGNNSFSASRLIPASYNEVITVSALADTDGKPGSLGGNSCFSWGSYDRDDTFANFSNYGSDVDLIAPGKCIWSTLPGERYGYLSGTSMAAPHVAGAAALWLSSRPGRTPSQVRAALRAVGTLDWTTSTDPDGNPDLLLNTAHIVAVDDFVIDVTQPRGFVGAAGRTVVVPIRLYRGEEVPGEIRLETAPDAPLGASLDVEVLDGPAATAATLRVTVPPGTATGTYDVTVTASRGDRTRDIKAVVRVDSDAPAVELPSLAAVRTSTFQTTSLTARAGWKAATDGGSGVSAYQVGWSVDGGSWTTQTLGSSARSLDRTLSTGRTYGFRVRARDAAGNWSPWRVQTGYGIGVTQDTSSWIARTGSWSTTKVGDWSRGSALYSRTKGSTVSRTLTGRALAWVAAYGPARGKARVYIDGTLAATVDLYRSSTTYRRIVFARSWTSSGTHTIRVEVVGTAGHPRVDMDAFIVIR